MPTTDQSLLTTAEAAEYLRLQPQSLRAMRCRGGGPPYCRVGSRPVYRRADIDAWLASRTFTSTSAESAAREGPASRR